MFRAALFLAAAVLGGVTTPVTAASPGTTAAPCAPLAIRAGLAEPKAGDIYLHPGPATCERAEVQVAGRGLDGVFTVSFAVRYPAALLRYEGYATGDLLARGSPATAPLYLVRTPAPGVVVVTMTRFAPDGGASAQGDATFVGLRFGRVAAGNATIDFDHDISGATPLRILGAAGETIAARFGPGHGAGVSVP